MDCSGRWAVCSAGTTSGSGNIGAISTASNASRATAPHSLWWRDFLKDTQGAGFWHEAYSAKGGVEAVYLGMPERTGLACFAPIRNPVGPFMSSRDRLRADALARSGAA